MLVEFTLSNWKSFRDEVTFSMLASRERQHGNRIYKSNRHKLRVLPIAAIFGGNASGKTNFVKALEFAKQFVVHGTRPNQSIPVEPFSLDPASREKPIQMVFELLIDDTIYQFGFSVTQHEVIDEELMIKSPASESSLYHRQGQQVCFGRKHKKDRLMDFVFQSTRPNELFLTKLMELNVHEFRHVFDWFDRNLQVITPDSQFGPIEELMDKHVPIFNSMNTILPLLDTNISRLDGSNISFDQFQQLAITDHEKDELDRLLSEGQAIRLLSTKSGDRFVVFRQNNKLFVKKLVTYHLASDGSEVKFDIAHESSGTQRMFDLVPAFLELSSRTSECLFVIDEIDRSLHPQLIAMLVEEYLDNQSNTTKSQLLFTTHNVLLIDQLLFRRDELWLTELDSAGSTDLFSLSEYKDIRYDKDIRKSYLDGRLGGTPHLMFRGTFGSIVEG